MKRLKNTHRWLPPILVFLLIFGFGLKAKANPHYNRGISFDVFYSELLPYGDWVRDSRHGYVWLPAVGPDFHPYATDGHWVMTEFGNTWVSYYDWGWAPFHYGRWYYDQYYRSWAWVPGYEWGPAWVSWRTGGGYYGWAPLRPGLSISVSFGIPFSSFIFLPRANLYAYNVFRFCPPRRNRVRIYNQTTIINNTVVYNDNRYIAGPSRRELQRVTNNRVPTYRTQSNGVRGRQVVSQSGRPLARSGSQVNSRSSRTPSDRGISYSRNSSRNSSRQSGVQRSTSNRNSGRNSDVRTSSPQRGFDVQPYSGNQRSTARSSSSRSSSSRSGVSSRSSNPRSSGSPGRSSVSSRSSRSNSTAAKPSQSQRVRERSTASSRSSSPRVNSRASQSRSSVSKPQRSQRSSVSRSSSRSSSPRVNSSSSKSRSSSTKARSSSRTSSKESSRTSRPSSRRSGSRN